MGLSYSIQASLKHAVASASEEVTLREVRSQKTAHSMSVEQEPEPATPPGPSIVR